MIVKIHDMVMDDRRLKVREIAESVGISIERVHKIFKDHLHMKKLSTRWVRRLLIIDNKQTRMTMSIECLELLNRNPLDFWWPFITVIKLGYITVHQKLKTT